MSSEALSEAKAWLEAIASADPELVRPSGLAAALLAEVARLERERHDLKRWNTRVVEQLAVAREREQRLRSALRDAIANLDAAVCADYPLWAALVDEPAAAGAAVPGRYQGGTDGEDSASAAADEPGETP